MATPHHASTHPTRDRLSTNPLRIDPGQPDPDLASGGVPAAAIPQVEPEDSELPTTTEVAEALGLDELALHEDVLDDERQRHPGGSGDAEDDGDRDAQVREFRQRLAEQ